MLNQRWIWISMHQADIVDATSLFLCISGQAAVRIYPVVSETRIPVLSKV